jgi:hypothetical protein
LLLSQGMTYVEAVWRMFGYLTILTNILIAVCSTVVLLIPGSAVARFLARPPRGADGAGVLYHHCWPGLQHPVAQPCPVHRAAPAGR